MSQLRTRFIEEMKLRGLAENTQAAYVRAVRMLSEFCRKNPFSISDEDLRRYLLHLRENRKLAAKSYNVHIAGISCFYESVYPDRKLPRLRRIRPPFVLPEVFSSEEVQQLLAAADSLKYKTILSLIYSSGLRAGECVRLKKEDIDSTGMKIRVRQAKGNKDRTTMLSVYALSLLRDYYKAYRPKHWLFEGNSKGRPLHIRSIQHVFRKAIKKAGITKKVRPHTLRHSFATHLLEQRCPLPAIQSFLGHKNLATTLVYTHITSTLISEIKNPLDSLMEAKKKGGRSRA